MSDARSLRQPSFKCWTKSILSVRWKSNSLIKRLVSSHKSNIFIGLGDSQDIDENTLIQLSYTTVPTSKDKDEEQEYREKNEKKGTHQTFQPQQQGPPLSPSTSDSSGPHSPTNTNSNVYPISMGRSGMPKESQTEFKPEVEASNYMPGYFPAHFQVPANKPSTEYWPNVPPMPDVSPYGY